MWIESQEPVSLEIQVPVCNESTNRGLVMMYLEMFCLFCSRVGTVGVS